MSKAGFLKPRLILTGCALGALAVPAYPRGNGFASAFASIAELSIGTAIVLGVSAALLVKALGLRPRVGMVSAVIGLALTGLLASLLIQHDVLLLLLFAPALIIFIAIYGIVSSLANRSQRARGRESIRAAARWLRAGGLWLGASYVFWAVFSLVNLHVLVGLAFPPAVLLAPDFYAKFMPFLVPPLMVSIVVAGTVSVAVVFSMPALDRRLAPFLFNGILLVGFLIAADMYKSRLISDALATRHPDCILSNTFLSSLAAAGADFQPSSHAMFEENGKKFFWSYSQRAFFEGSEGVSRNFSCRSTLGRRRNIDEHEADWSSSG